MKCRLALKWVIYFYDLPAAPEILMRFAWKNFFGFFVFFFFLFTLISHNAGSLMCCDLLLIVGIFLHGGMGGEKKTQRWQLVEKEKRASRGNAKSECEYFS